ncbi:MAG: acetyltransferase [Candidatus Saccharimonadaceae bacterium]
MKNIVIIGARGFGREYYDDGVRQKEKYGSEYIIKGYLDDKSDALSGYVGYPPIISSVEDYEIEKDDIFICALGDPLFRRNYVDIILAKGGEFISIISNESIIHANAKIGKGVMISAFCNISSDVVIGDFTIVQPFCNLGHDAQIGEYCSLESYTFMGGFSKTGDNVTLHTRSTILPHIKVGDNSIVGAGSVVIRNVKENTTVFGVPAKKLIY